MYPKAPNAQSGAIIQKTIICSLKLAPHQQTMSIPKLRLLAAMHHPRQKAKAFRLKQVKNVYLSSGMLPMSHQVRQMKTVKVMRINEAMQTDVRVPTQKTKVQIMLRTFVTPKKMWVLRLHTFFTRLQILAIRRPVQMKAQIVKKYPGGVIQSLNLSETSAFLLIPTKQLTKSIPMQRSGVKILMGQCRAPSSPKAVYSFAIQVYLFLLSISSLPCVMLNCYLLDIFFEFGFDKETLQSLLWRRFQQWFNQKPTRKNQSTFDFSRNHLKHVINIKIFFFSRIQKVDHKELRQNEPNIKTDVFSLLALIWINFCHLKSQKGIKLK